MSDEQASVPELCKTCIQLRYRYERGTERAGPYCAATGRSALYSGQGPFTCGYRKEKAA